MLNNNHQFVCRYADEIVAYIYDEISTRDKSAFENHLAHCSNCAAEVADFSSIQTAFADWRETEFAPLQSPQIIIPFANKTSALINNQPKLSLTERIRAAFALQTVWQTVGVSLAVLIVGLIAALFMLKNFNPAQTANLTTPVNQQNDAPFDSAAPVPTVEVAASEIPPTRIETNSRETNRKTSGKVALTGEKQQNRLAANQNIRPKSVLAHNLKPSNSLPNRDEALAQNGVKAGKPLHLSVDDDDDISDNSLRLSDLLDETDK